MVYIGRITYYELFSVVSIFSFDYKFRFEV